jgi:hypothetical protein
MNKNIMTTKSQAQSAAGMPVQRQPAIGIGQHALVYWRSARSFLAIFLVAALLLFTADVLLLALHPSTYRVAIGNYRDKFFLQDANFQESAAGATYRWTNGQSTLTLGQIGITPHALLTLDLGGRPEAAPLDLTINDQPWTSVTAATQPRRYTLLLPPDLPGELAIGLHSPTFTPPNDSRQLGVKIEAFALTMPRTATPLPTAPLYGWQLGLLLAVQLTALRLGARWPVQAIMAGALALGLAALLSGALLLMDAYLPSLAVAGVALAAMTWIGLPLAERHLLWAGPPREIRLWWALMLVACAIRLVAVLYPTFDGQDLGRNVGRLVMTVQGQMIIIGPSSEFAQGLTIYPTGPYISIMPALTFTNDLAGVMEGAVTLLEGTTAFLVALLVRRLGGSREAARFALVLYAGNIASFSALVYCFSAQIFGQWFTTPMALVLLASAPTPRLRAWGLAVLMLMFGIYSHIGVAILAVTWMGFMLLLSLRRPTRAVWWAIGMCVAGGLVAFGLLYVDIAAVMLSHAATNVIGGSEDTGALRGATPLLIKGARLSYSDVGLALLPFGLLLLARSRAMRGRWFVLLGALLTVLLYLAVDLLLAVQVRYFYFALPFALAIIAIVLGRLAAHGRATRLATWALVLGIAFMGVAQWFSTTFGDGSISMTPLTH